MVTFVPFLILGDTFTRTIGTILFVSFVIVYLLIVVGMVWVELAERRIPIQYANRTNSAYGGRQNFLPIKINTAGVIPVIFASTLLTIPVTVVNLINKESAVNFVNNYNCQPKERMIQ